MGSKNSHLRIKIRIRIPGKQKLASKDKDKDNFILILIMRVRCRTACFSQKEEWEAKSHIYMCIHIVSHLKNVSYEDFC